MSKSIEFNFKSRNSYSAENLFLIVSQGLGVGKLLLPDIMLRQIEIFVLT